MKKMKVVVSEDLVQIQLKNGSIINIDDSMETTSLSYKNKVVNLDKSGYGYDDVDFAVHFDDNGVDKDSIDYPNEFAIKRIIKEKLNKN